jgi:hypothetical protein
MKTDYSRRSFVKKSAVNAVSLGVLNNVPLYGQTLPSKDLNSGLFPASGLPFPVSLPFAPTRAASWWCGIEDLLWSEKKIIDKIKRRAEAFAEAKIDTAINFGFHFRFNFADYFGQLNQYYANVCEELHKNDIKFIDHYSCNLIARPRGGNELKKINRGQRHVVLLFADEMAAENAQYEGHKFNDLCEIDLRDGRRGYSARYQTELFCHNNPAFLDMHEKYLLRLMKEVPFDAIEVDDMVEYGALTTCGCPYCRERFKRDYRHEIPPFGEKSFWGDTTKPVTEWGNYENPEFRDWLRMKTDTLVDHIKMVKRTIGDKPLMTCVSSSGPIFLNSYSLNLERLAPHLDLFMLENVGTNIKCVDWVKMDAEALLQKDVAFKRGNAPALALSYTIYDKGGYLGWSLSRFWGVGNWSSTLNGRLEQDPQDAMETEAIIGPYNNWEAKYSNLNYLEGKDFAEVRLASSIQCRENGWRGPDGKEQWDKVSAWSSNLLKRSITYRFVRSEELSDAKTLCHENTPLILDSLGCVSDQQFNAVKTYLSQGGTAWLALPFGTHDEKGFKRAVPLVEDLLKHHYKNLFLLETITSSDSLDKLIQKGSFRPVLNQVSGDKRWAVRIRIHQGRPVFHFMNTALTAVAHPTLKDVPGVPILMDMESKITDNNLTFEVDTHRLKLSQLFLMSPELGEAKVVSIQEGERGVSIINANLKGIKTYAVMQST